MALQCFQCGVLSRGPGQVRRLRIPHQQTGVALATYEDATRRTAALEILAELAPPRLRVAMTSPLLVVEIGVDTGLAHGPGWAAGCAIAVDAEPDGLIELCGDISLGFRNRLAPLWAKSPSHVINEIARWARRVPLGHTPPIIRVSLPSVQIPIVERHIVGRDQVMFQRIRLMRLVGSVVMTHDPELVRFANKTAVLGS